MSLPGQILDSVERHIFLLAGECVQLDCQAVEVGNKSQDSRLECIIKQPDNVTVCSTAQCIGLCELVHPTVDDASQDPILDIWMVENNGLLSNSKG